jgi:hypothetical protein
MKTTNMKPVMLGLAELRDKLGFNQELMALYLNVNLSTIKLAEVGLRSLPTYALIKFAELEMKLVNENGQPEYKNIHPSEQSELTGFWEQYDWFAGREIKFNYECFLLESRLASMASTYQKTRERLRIIENTLEENKLKEFDPGDWQRQKEIAINVLKKCGLPTQVLLKSKLEFLQSEIELGRKAQLQIRTALPELFPGNDDELK